MTRAWHFVFGLIVGVSCTATPTSAQTAAERATARQDTAERVKGLLARFIETHRASWRGGRPMLSVAAGRDGRVLVSIGLGAASDGTTPSGDTLYRIGSISKQMTAAAVLRAIEAGATTGGGRAASCRSTQTLPTYSTRRGTGDH